MVQVKYGQAAVRTITATKILPTARKETLEVSLTEFPRRKLKVYFRNGLGCKRAPTRLYSGYASSFQAIEGKTKEE